MQSFITFNIPFSAWHSDNQISIGLPSQWNVYRADPNDGNALSQEQIDFAFRNSIGTGRISELAENKKTAVIAVEDITRPAPVHQFIDKILSELQRGGIVRHNIKIVIGTGAHRPMNDAEIRLKLGEKTAEEFPVYVHNFISEENVFLGYMDGGPVFINKEFLNSDLKILVGSVIPHGDAGFGGGAKLLVPGLAGEKTIAHFHGAIPSRPKGIAKSQKGKTDKRDWAEIIARKIGVDCIVCAVVNSKRQLAGLFVGDLNKAHLAASEAALQVYRTKIDRKIVENAKIVIANCYPLDTDPIQMGKSLGIAKKIPADLAISINAASDGVFYHGMGMGSGIETKRLLANIPRLLKPHNMAYFGHSFFVACRHPSMIPQSVYFSLNSLSYNNFQAKYLNVCPETSETIALKKGAKIAVFSPKFPLWGFKKKYKRAALYRDWDNLIQDVSKQYEKTAAILFPCAPLQILEIT